jgi:antitoxin component of RelBE/YafQ-DinJ toxin-antitoxin module
MEKKLVILFSEVRMVMAVLLNIKVVSNIKESTYNCIKELAMSPTSCN